MNLAICGELNEERATIAEYLCAYLSEPKLSEYMGGAELVRTSKEAFHMAAREQTALTAKLEEFLTLCGEPDFCLSDGTLLRISHTFLSDAKKAHFDYVFGKDGVLI